VAGNSTCKGQQTKITSLIGTYEEQKARGVYTKDSAFAYLEPSTIYGCAIWQIIDFPPTLPMIIVDECAFASLLRRSYSQQRRPSLRRSQLGRRSFFNTIGQTRSFGDVGSMSGLPPKQ
jgi:hypothetical protein